MNHTVEEEEGNRNDANNKTRWASFFFFGIFEGNDSCFECVKWGERVFDL